MISSLNVEAGRGGRVLFLLHLLCILCSGCAHPPAAERVTAITNVFVVDVERGSVGAASTVLINGKRIARVGSGTPVPRAAQVVDGTGKFLIPGLWDMHTHHQASGREALGLYVANGVLGTRDMGSELLFILPLREDLRRGKLAGPAIFASGPVLDAAPAGWPWRMTVRDREMGRAAVGALAAAGVDFIKVHDNTPRDAFFAIASEARARRLPFVGHVPVGVRISEAAASGMRSIEHLSNSRVWIECSGGLLYRASECATLFSTLSKHQVWQTPTFAFFQGLPDMMRGHGVPHQEFASRGQLDLWRKNLDAANVSAEMLKTLEALNQQNLLAARDLLRSGSNFLAGTDGLVAGFSLHDELGWMVRAGFSPAEALRTATINPAVFLGIASSTGSVAEGKVADLVLLEGNPLADISNTRRISAVIYGGRVLNRTELDRLLAAAPHPKGAK